MSSFQVKIVGDFCDLRCTYCRNRSYDRASKTLMSVETLKNVIRLMSSVPKASVRANWHGGEPLLAGKEFFMETVAVEQQHPRIQWVNGVQTNGTMIDDWWSSFFVDNNFHVGVSMDGSERTHDMQRVRVNGRGTYRDVMRGVEALRRRGACPGVLCTVTKRTADSGGDMLLSLVTNGFKEIAFNAFYNTASERFMDPYAVSDREWLRFLIDIFECWVELDDPTVHVRELDSALAWTKSRSSNCCVYKGTCHQWFSIYHDGSIYPCERHGRTRYFGNANSTEQINELLTSESYVGWKTASLALPDKCCSCDVRSMCHNGCTAHRVGDTSGSPHFAYCESRLGFYKHIQQRLREKEKLTNDEPCKTSFTIV